MNASRSEPGAFGLVSRDGALDAADEHVEPLVAIEVDERRDVLPVEEDVLSVGVLQRTGILERRRRPASRVPVVADVAERQLGQQVLIAVAVEIDESVPLADLEVLIPIGAPFVFRRLRGARVLEEPDGVR